MFKRIKWVFLKRIALKRRLRDKEGEIRYLKHLNVVLRGEVHDREMEAKQNHNKYALACNRQTKAVLEARFLSRQGLNIDRPVFEWNGFKFYTDLSLPKDVILIHDKSAERFRQFVYTPEGWESAM